MLYGAETPHSHNVASGQAGSSSKPAVAPDLRGAADDILLE